MAKFIGLEALKEIAKRFQPQIVMGPAYFAPEELDRLGINVISGVQFKDIKVVMARKGGTTRKKVVGESVANKIGYLEERPLVAKLAWNRYVDNRDNYVETPYQVEGSADFSYPMSETAFKAIMANYGEDLFANLFFGNAEAEGPLSLYDGFHTVLAHDMEEGLISESLKNLVPMDAFTAPTSTSDYSAWSAFEKWQAKWSPALKRSKVLVYTSVETGIFFANAYSNKYHGNAKVNYLDNGNFTVPEYPKVTFVPSDDFGKGDLVIATIPGNFEYGVNSLDSRNKIHVQEGSDNDAEDIIFQVQSIQGTRCLNIHPNCYCQNDGEIQPAVWTGDYQSETFPVTATEGGSVTVNGEAPDNTKEYAVGTQLTLVATADETHEFVKWSNGVEDSTIRVKTVPNGSITAIFKTKG